MPLYSCQAILEAVGAIPADAVTNTWHFSALADGDLEDAAGQLLAFYGDIESGLSDQLSGNIQLKFYDLADPQPRVPVYMQSDTLTLGANDAMPAQVSLVMSFEAAIISGGNRARRRNRVFLGPWSENVNLEGRPTSGLITTIVGAAEVLLAASSSAGNWSWEVYSPTDTDNFGVQSGWVDNRWDTQRRRLPRATNRTTFSV